VVTSAGVAVPGYFGDIPLEAHERSMAVNYFGSALLLCVPPFPPCARAEGGASSSSPRARD
jgi:hypothetical protein